MAAHPDDDPTGLVFDVQRFSVDDGPGIRTTVFLKGCPFRCAWCQNPESIDPGPEVGFRVERCIGCGACQEACPTQAIAVDRISTIDRDRCDGCGACAETCPSGALWALGRRYTVSHLLEEVRRDEAFYAGSGGGVTLSGGEPTLQFDFVLQFLKACKQAGVDTSIETNGATAPDRLTRLLPYLDRVFFDLKIMDPVEHRRLAGTGNGQTLDNARMLVASRAPVVFRLPTVPSMTAGRGNVHDVGAFLGGLGVPEIELCPYHVGWEHKLRWLGRAEPSSPELRAPISEVDLEAVRDALKEHGVVARWRA